MFNRQTGSIAALALSLAFAACAPQPAVEAVPTADLAAEEAAIRELDRRWVERVAARDVDWIVDLYAPQGRLLAPNAPPAVGHGAVRGAWQGIISIPQLSLVFQPTEIEVAPGGRMAYDVGTYTMSFQGPQGLVQDRGKYLVVWEKIGGEWKVAADMFNTDVPAQ
jgi:ketosteroid isomerase-like protein